MRKVVLWFAIFCMTFLSSNLVAGEEDTITAGKVVKFDYVLTVEGEVVDSSEGSAPLEYIHGQKMIIEGLESKLEGLRVGDKKTVVVSPEDGYGPVDQRAIIEIPKANLGDSLDPQVGMMIQMTGSAGESIPGKVVEVKEEFVVLDFNHPLAGKELKFEVEIVEVK